MGGRGSNYGGGSRLGALPQLSGSAKQVAWAEDIRSTYAKHYNNLINAGYDKNNKIEQDIDYDKMALSDLLGVKSADIRFYEYKKSSEYKNSWYYQKRLLPTLHLSYSDKNKWRAENPEIVKKGREWIKKKEVKFQKDFLNDVKKKLKGEKTSRFWIDRRHVS